MAIPEGHVERVCLRNGTMCPHLVSIVDGVRGTRRHDCMKGKSDLPRFYETIFADDPELVHAITEGMPAGNCSGTPAYFEYPRE